MSRLPLKLLTGFTLLLLVFVLSLWVLAVLIDPNDYKTNLAALLKDKAGRDVVFEDDIKVSVFPRLGLRTGKIVIYNRQGFQNRVFVAADKSEIGVNLLPLLARKLDVGNIVLDGLTVNLIKDKQGANNWDDLVALSTPSLTQAKPDTEDANAVALTGLAIAGITIHNASINWENQQTGKRLEFKNIQFNADTFVFGEPVRINMVMEVDSQFLKSPGTVKWIADLRVDENLDNFMFNDTHIELAGFKNIAADPTLVSTITVSTASVNLNQQTVNLAGLHLQSGELKLSAEISGNHIMAKPSFQGPVLVAPFNPNNMMKQWSIPLPTMRDAKALTNLAMTFQVQVTPSLADFTGVDLSLDDSRAKGTVTITDFTQPGVAFDLTVDTLDVDRYLAPSKSKPLGSGLNFASDSLSLSLDELKKLNVEGSLTIDKMTYNRMTFQNMRVALNSKNGLVGKLGTFSNLPGKHMLSGYGQH